MVKKNQFFLYLLKQQKITYELYFNTQLRMTNELLYHGIKLKIWAHVREIDYVLLYRYEIVVTEVI